MSRLLPHGLPFWGSHAVASLLTCIPSTQAPLAAADKRALGDDPKMSSQPQAALDYLTHSGTPTDVTL